MSSNNMTVDWKNDQTLGELMKDLLTRALDAHGGLSRWREIKAFQLKVSIGGGLWRLKGLPDGLRDVTLRVQAHRPIVTITPFGGEARTGHFTPDRVWVEDANGGVLEERATPRASFGGHVLTTPWENCRNSTSWATHCGTTWRLRSCAPNPASRPVRAGHTRKTARRGTAFGGIVIPTLRRAVSRTPKGAVFSGPMGVLLQMSDITLIPNAPKEKNNDRERTT